MKSPLRPGEKAVEGQQDLNGVLWDAVFAQTCEGQTRLLAYVEDGVASILVEALNERRTQ